MKIKKKKKIILVVIIGILSIIGAGFALNGYFGGGASIPEDTMARGLVGYWSFDEAGGTTAYDASDNSHNGTLTNGPKYTEGKIGNALQFDGSNDYVHIGDISETSVKTVELWAKPDAINVTEDPLDLNGTQYVKITSGTVSGEGFISPTVYIDGLAGTTVTANWHHIVITTNTGFSASDVDIGRLNTTYFNGLIDEVRIYNRALTASEVRYHYNRGGPVSHWKFDEGEGQIVYDSTNNNNDGTLGATSASASDDPSWVAGKHNSALEFDGVNDYVSIPDDDSLDITDAITIGLWINDPPLENQESPESSESSENQESPESPESLESLAYLGEQELEQESEPESGPDLEKIEQELEKLIQPTILSASIEPTKVQPGDTMLIKAEIKENDSITDKIVNFFHLDKVADYITGKVSKLDIAQTKIQQKYQKADKIKQNYKIHKASFIKKAEDENAVQIEVGDKSSDKFKPEMTLRKWGDETSFKIEYAHNVAEKDQSVKLEDNKIKWVNHKTEVHYYEMKKGEKLNGAELESDVYEVEVLLLEKPDTNVVGFEIETKGLVYYYQPPLNEEENPEADYCTETHCYKNEQVVTHRPENVVGSYAVYHESKSGDYSKMGLKNYRAGKAFHIYRPKIIDSAGTEVWGKLDIDVESGLLTVEIPQEFLDNAVYPVRHAAGLTFGYESIGGTQQTLSANYIRGYRDTPAFSGDADYIKLYIDGYWDSGEKVRCALYEGATTFVDDTEELTTGGTGWVQFNFSPVVAITAQEYSIVGFFENSINVKYDSVDPNGHASYNNGSQTYPTWVSTLYTSTCCNYSIYCSYSTNAAPTTPTLSKLFDNEKTADTTPAFEFKSTDAESEDIEYQIEIDDDYNFGSINVSKTSETDAGFVNTENGSDTHPFTQNQTIRFTVQAGDALTNGTTYWWRVKAKDPSGSNTWGSYSSKRSFTIDTSVTVPTWFQTTEEQFDTDTLTDTTTMATDKVQLGAILPSFAAVTTNSSSSSRTSATFSHTVPAGDNRLLIVTVGVRGSLSVSSVTYGGTNLALAKAESSGSSSGERTEIWYLAAPSTGANNVVVTYASTVNPDGIAALSYTGANQSNPIGATAGAQATSGTDTTVDITTTESNSLIVGGLANLGADTDPHAPGSGTTERYDFQSGTSTISDDTYAGGEESTTTAGTYTFNFTSNASDDWTIAAVEVKGVSGTAASGNIISSTINYDDGTSAAAWDDVLWNDDETNGDIKYQVQYWDGDSWELVPDSTLSGNSTGFDTSPIDISALNTTTYNQIRLKGNFTDSSGTPYLQDWTVTWNTNAPPDTPTQSKLFDNEKTADTTPDFEFKSTDAESEDIEYQIEIDDDYNFGSINLTKISTTDTGFVNTENGGDTHPFTQNQTIRFTVQAGDALTNGITYWWRVKAKDPSGSNDWSSYSSKRSFTIDTSVTVPTWFQTTEEQFDTDTLTDTETTATDKVQLSTGGSGWYNTDWGYRKKITLDSDKVPNTNQSNFPVLISRTDADWKDTDHSGHIQVDGGDILFTNSSGTKLDHEIEKYDGATGELIAWVEVDTLSASADTEVYIYYGNATCADQWDIAGTWDSSYVGVWHLHDDFLDSSGSNNGTNYGSDDATGKIADAQDFVRANTDYIDVGNILVSGSCTIELWMNLDINNQRQFVFGKWNSGGNVMEGISIEANDGGILRLQVGNGGASMQGWDTTLAYTTGEWQYVAGIADGSNLTMWRNATSQSTGQTQAVGGNTIKNSIGRPGDCDGIYADGFIDEVRISDTNRSADWISTCYNSQSSPSTFIKSVASEEASAASSGSIISSTIDYDDGTSAMRWDEVSWNDDETNGDIKYQVQYYTGSTWALVPDGALSGNSTGFDTSPIDISALNTTTYNEIRLKGNFTDSSGTPYLQDWTVIWSTNAAPNTPTLSSPSDGAVGQSVTLDLVFNYSDTDSDTCTKFDLKVDNDSGFGSPEVNETDYSTGGPWASGGTITYSVASGLSASTKYYWKVRVYDGTAWSDWSDGSWDFTTGTGKKIISKGDSPYKIEIDDSLNVIGYIDNQTVTTQITKAWHYVVLTYDKDAGGTDEIKLYVDGVLKDTADYSTAMTTNSDVLKIGDKIPGKIDDVRIYDYARTPDEIRLDYNAGFAAMFGASGKSCSQDPASCMDIGLAGYWNMDEGDGTIAYDASDNSNDGTLTNSPKWTNSSPPNLGGVGGGSLSFDGQNDYVHIGDISETGVKTVELWVKPDAVNVTEDPLDLNGTQYVKITSGTVSGEGFTSPTVYVDGLAGTTVTANWHHIVITTNTGFSASDVDIGRLNTTYFNGLIDEVRIYNRALTASEIRYHYNRGGPVSHWRFDEGEGQIVYDSTDSNNDGTLGATSASASDDPSWVAGKHNSALEFDGVNDYVSIPDDDSLDITDAITIGLWINDPPLESSESLESPEILTQPTILNASVEPTKVQPGDTMLVKAEIQDNYGIESVTADMGGIEIIELRIKNQELGESEEAPKQGIWEAEWLVHDTEIKNYITTIAATNVQGLSSSVEIRWSDPTWTSPDSVSSSDPSFTYTNTIDENLTSQVDWDGSKTLPGRIIYDMTSTYTISQLRIYNDLETGVLIGDDVICGLSEVYICDDSACSGESNLLGSPCAFTGDGSLAWHNCDHTDADGRYVKIAFGLYQGTMGGGCVYTGSEPLKNFHEFEAYCASTNNAPSTPTISSPSDGAPGQSLTPDLVFNYSDTESDTCTKFDLKVDNDSGFGSPEVNETDYTSGGPWASGGTITYSVSSGLSYSTKYYWKVRVYDGTDWSNWSDGSWDFTTGTGKRIISKGDSPYKIEIDDSLNVTGYIDNQTVTTQITKAWHYVVLTYDKDAGGTDEIKLYVDGVLKDTADYSTAMTTNSDVLKIGDKIPGKIDDVRIYDYARTPDEIRLDYNAGFAAKFGASGKSCSQDPASCMNVGLAGYWNMDEGAGTTAYDASDNSHNGTLTNGPKYTEGKIGNALEFDGSNDYVDCGSDSSLNIIDNVTVEAWIYPESWDSAGYDPIVEKTGSHDTGWMLTQDWTELKFKTLENWGVASYAGFLSSACSLNHWHHLVGVYDDTYIYIYLDGVLKDTTPIVKPTTTTGNLYIGSIPADSKYFNGAIDEVRIYNRALTASEVRYHYNRGGPVSHWKFDEGEGQVVYDSTNNNNDGTLGATSASASDDPSWVVGKYNSALEFDGTNDYVSIPDDDSLDITDAITLGLWVYDPPPESSESSEDSESLTQIEEPEKLEEPESESGPDFEQEQEQEQEKLTQPTILNALVEPTKVQPGDVILARAEIKDNYGIESAKLDITEKKLQTKYQKAGQVIKQNYKLEKASFIKEAKDKDAIQIEIGDKTKDEFIPEMTIRKWDDEVNFNIKYKHNIAPKDQTVDLGGEKIKWKNHKTEVHYYEMKKGEKLNGAELESDVYEVEVLLLEKPDTNVVGFEIETKGLVYYYQPPLNEEENPEADYCTETHCYKNEQVVIHRPENVVGSYAVYHESKAGDYSKMGLKNYRAGKAFHIYRPKIIDSAGKEVWGELKITDSILSVEIPQEFLDNAVYPIRHAAGLTFGYTTEGQSNTYSSYNETPSACVFTPAEAGTISSISGYVGSYGGASNGVFAIYSDSSSYPSVKLANGTQASWAADTTLKSQNVVYEFSDSTPYWLYFAAMNGSQAQYDAGTTNQFYRYSGSTESLLVSPFTGGSTGYNRKISIYCTYTPANTAPNVPTISSPSDGATGQSLTPDLVFNYSDTESDNCAKFDLQVDDDSGFGSPEVNETDYTSGGPWASGGTITYSVSSGLSESTKYYWKVRVYDGTEWSNWSDGSWDFTTGTGKKIISKGNSPYKIEIDDSLNVTGYIDSQTVTTQITKAWHHIVLTYDKDAGGTDEIKLYVDGVLKDTADYSTAMTTNADVLKIGDKIPGKIDDVKIYAYARTPDEIRLDYNAGLGTHIK